MQCGAAAPHKRVSVCYKLRPKAHGVSLSKPCPGPSEAACWKACVYIPRSPTGLVRGQGPGSVLQSTSLEQQELSVCHTCAPELCQLVLGHRPAACRAMGPRGVMMHRETGVQGGWGAWKAGTGRSWRPLGAGLCVGEKVTGQKSRQPVQALGFMAKLLITNQCYQYRPQ